MRKYESAKMRKFENSNKKTKVKRYFARNISTHMAHTILSTPFSIQNKILSYVPAELRSLAMLTCKQWFSTIKNLKDFQKVDINSLGVTFVENGNLEGLTFINKCGYKWNSSMCTAAARAGKIDSLKHLHENKCEWDAKTCESAADGGHLDCLRYAHENGCPWDKRTCEAAALRGHLACLRYAHENKCEWDDYTCDKAAVGDNLSCLKYAFENGCLCTFDSYKQAVFAGAFECVNFLEAKGVNKIR